MSTMAWYAFGDGDRTMAVVDGVLNMSCQIARSSCLPASVKKV
jgi:hypothetical protein